MDPNQGNYASNNISMHAKWPVNNGLAISTTDVETPPNVCFTSMPNGTVSSATTAISMRLANDSNFYGTIPPREFFYSQQVRTTPNVKWNLNLYEPIILSNAVLTPPLPGEKMSRRLKPDGCRTVYVGNFPEKITEDIIKELFERCGSISSIRKKKDRFCHIRFAEMETVEKALLLSGYQIKIEGKDGPANSGKLHVDYALDCDDQHDFECRVRQMEREERHREKKPRLLSPPPIPWFTESEAVSVNDKLRNGERFKEGAQILVRWLERGECSKQNHGIFYSMLESTNCYTKRLMKEISRCEEEAEKARENLDIVARNIQLGLSEIEKVYASAELKKNWDHFSKGQRRQIDDFKKEVASFRAALITLRVDEGMDLDMDENAEEDQTENDKLYQLTESNDTVKQQLTSTQKELDDYKLICYRYFEDILKLKCVSGVPVENIYYSDNVIKDVSVTNSSTQCVPDKIDDTENETCLVSLISVFLHVHPFGANIDYICSYMLETFSAITTRDIESLLRKFPNIFKDERTGIGATLQKKWKYVAFGSSTLPNSHFYSDKARKDVSVSNSSVQCVPDKVDVTEYEICLVTLISVFLYFHPFGANIDYICSYMLETYPAITTRDIESLLKKFPKIFKDVPTGIGATLQKKWKYVALHSSTHPNSHYLDNARKDVSVTNTSRQSVPDKVDITENETCLVTLISVFLHVHPFGANIDYICSYMLETFSAITARDIESLLRKFPNIFKDERTGIGATLQKKWKYVAFGSSTLPNSHFYSDKARKDVSATNSSVQCVPDKVDVTENETCLVTLISVFLHVHPFGANIDYICSYMLETHPTITARDIESLLRKFPNIFEDISIGIGATLQKKWKYIAFGSSALPNSH